MGIPKNRGKHVPRIREQFDKNQIDPRQPLDEAIKDTDPRLSFPERVVELLTSIQTAAKKVKTSPKQEKSKQATPSKDTQASTSDSQNISPETTSASVLDFTPNPKGGIDSLSDKAIAGIRAAAGMGKAYMPDDVKIALEGQEISQKIYNLLSLYDDYNQNEYNPSLNELGNLFGDGTRDNAIDKLKHSRYKNVLTQAEATAIYSYTGSGYAYFNDFLRNLDKQLNTLSQIEPSDKELYDQTYIKIVNTLKHGKRTVKQVFLMLQGLAKMMADDKKHNRHRARLFTRGASYIMPNQEKDIVYDSGFTSVANSASKEGWYGKKGQYAFYTKQAVDMTGLSGFGGTEREYLVFPGTQFILDKAFQMHNKNNFVLTEIDDDAQRAPMPVFDEIETDPTTKEQKQVKVKGKIKHQRKDLEAGSGWYKPHKYTAAQANDVLVEIMEQKPKFAEGYAAAQDKSIDEFNQELDIRKRLSKIDAVTFDQDKKNSVIESFNKIKNIHSDTIVSELDEQVWQSNENAKEHINVMSWYLQNRSKIFPETKDGLRSQKIEQNLIKDIIQSPPGQSKSNRTLAMNYVRHTNFMQELEQAAELNHDNAKGQDIDTLTMALLGVGRINESLKSWKENTQALTNIMITNSKNGNQHAMNNSWKALERIVSTAKNAPKEQKNTWLNVLAQQAYQLLLLTQPDDKTMDFFINLAKEGKLSEEEKQYIEHNISKSFDTKGFKFSGIFDNGDDADDDTDVDDLVFDWEPEPDDNKIIIID